MKHAITGSGPSSGVPELRQDLVLIQPDAFQSAQRWLIYDPARHRYHEVDRATFALLAAWRPGASPADVAEAASRQSGDDLRASDVAGFIEFGEREYLLAEPLQGGWRKYAQIGARARRSPASWLVHNYLFFKIPLINPQEFLSRTKGLAAAIASRTAAILLGVLGVLALYFVSREWDALFAQLAALWSLEGALAFLLALIVVKVLHELGHAYAAVLAGCRVPAMGIAFMVLAPMLYTDVTDAWRLGSRRQRLAIDAAGVVVELGVAVIASFLWVFLPPGTMKSVVLIVATTSWLMSLAINLNPFMRFDGYYLLSDLIGVANLQHRAFALGRWRLREFLFGLGEPAPELFETRLRRGLVFYAYATWIYRLVLFIGVALLVYHYFFKALGVFLFAVEIIFFIAKPVWSELMEWKARWRKIAARSRGMATIGFAASMLALAFVPWSGRVEVPVVLEPASLARIYPPLAAEVVTIEVRNGQRVEAGELIAQLKSEQLQRDQLLVEREMRAIGARLSRIAADRSDREQAIVLERELAALRTKAGGLRRLESQLRITAPLSGRVVEVGPQTHVGRTLAPSHLIAVVAGENGSTARGYVAEQDVARIQTGNQAHFVFDDGRRATLQLEVGEVGYIGAKALEIADLSSTHGGAIDAVLTPAGDMSPSAAQYPVSFALSGSYYAGSQRVGGLAIVAGAPESFARRVWRQVVRVLVREGGA